MDLKLLHNVHHLCRCYYLHHWESQGTVSPDGLLTAEFLLEDVFITKGIWSIPNYRDKSLIFKKIPAILAILEFLSTAEGLVFSFCAQRIRKVVQGVFVVLHSGDKDEHSIKLLLKPN